MTIVLLLPDLYIKREPAHKNSFVSSRPLSAVLNKLKSLKDEIKNFTKSSYDNRLD